MKPMLLGVMLAMVTGAATAQTVRTSLKPDSGIVLGQPVRLFVDVLFPDAMPRPPRVSLPDMPGAQIVRYETQATTMSERIDGKDHVGQRFEFALYPRRGGMLEVPAAQITTLDAKGEAVGQIQGRSLRLDVTVPPGVDASRPVVATGKLTLEEAWSPQPAAPFKTGDALVRTVTRTATDVPGMAMLDLLFPAPAGIRVYLDPPQTVDHVDRGEVTGRRVDRVTYVFERAGSFPIPSVAQPWWDLEANRLRQAEGSGTTVAVTATAPPASRGDLAERWAFITTTLLGGLALAWWMAPRVVHTLADRRERWLTSERKAFRDLSATCRRADAAATYRAFVTWRRRAPPAVALAPLAEEIEGAVFAGAPWSVQIAQGFAAKLRSARHPAPGRAHPREALPPLNPVPLETDMR